MLLALGYGAVAKPVGSEADDRALVSRGTPDPACGGSPNQFLGSLFSILPLIPPKNTCMAMLKTQKVNMLSVASEYTKYKTLATACMRKKGSMSGRSRLFHFDYIKPSRIPPPQPIMLWSEIRRGESTAYTSLLMTEAYSPVKR